MEKFKQVLVGVLAIGILTSFSAGEVFAEVPNGRVDTNIPEPSGTMKEIDTRANEDENVEEVATEPEVVTEEIVTEEETEVLVENEDNSLDEMWPVYLSLGGIVFTLFLILIINLIHRKSKK